MQVVQAVKEMQSFSESLRGQGKRIAFVPTMGYFHEGHLNLMREGRRRSDFLAVSIYVNPKQFGPKEDLTRYPRDFERDRQLAKSVGVDVIFFPSDLAMYPPHYQTYVSVEDVTKNLCGFARPGHFSGVSTICTKLFNIVKPHVAVFGKKDFQQLVTIRRMVADLNMDLEIIGMNTTREADGLAMSSRNVYLNDAQRASALSLFRSLRIAKEVFNHGERKAPEIIARVVKFIEGHPETVIDYVRICDTTTLEDVEDVQGEAVIALAVKVGATRLIDNYVFGETLDGIQ